MKRVGVWGNTLVANHAAPDPRYAHDAKRLKASVQQSRLDEMLVRDINAPRRAPFMKDALKLSAIKHKEAQNEQVIGGLRRPQISVTKVPSLVPTGKAVRALMDKFLDEHPTVQLDCLASIGSDVKTGPSDEYIHEIRLRLGKLLGTEDVGPVSRGDFSTEICAGLLKAWVEAAADPDTAVPCWLMESGVPAGIRIHPEDKGIFPRNADRCGDSGDLEAKLESDPSNFVPYQSVEGNGEADKEIARYVAKGWLKKFGSLQSLIDFFGENPVLSKFALIIKMRAGKLKTRLILNSKESGVSEQASKRERVILPRLLDVVFDILALLSGGKSVELLVLDFADAFWLLPMAPQERRFFTSQHRGNFYVFLRNAQGSRNAPLGWGRLAALVSRLTQSLFDKMEFRLQTYTDDPCAAVAGNRAQRDRLIAITTLLWRALGFPLSWRKGSRGKNVDWIGGQFQIAKQPPGVTVRIKPELFADTLEVVQQFRGLNVIPLKALRSGIGKLSHIANLLTTWRPFLPPLYGALYGDHPAGAPLNCIWAKQIAVPLKWFASFFHGSGGQIERNFLLDSYTGGGDKVEITVDASPWGLAAVLIVNGCCTHFFSDAISQLDVALFQYEIGSCRGQQVWESLAALVALRLWKRFWSGFATTLLVRGDSVTMLTLIVNMRPSSPQLCLLGQEMALDFADASFSPIISQHIPGVANVVADKLSRWHQPGYTSEVPHFVANATRGHPPVRDKSYYRTLSLPPEPNI